ncbi:unnamed protein product [Hapterophycus canaliculatus]
MAIGKASKHESDPEEESEEEGEEESEEESSGDESYDYGFVGADNEEDEEDSDYEVDYASMNVSPEILRMLGASEEVIAAKEAEVSGVTSTWVAPTETGLEHSAAIADSAAVAIGGGAASGGGGVERVFKAVGSFDKDAAVAGAVAEDGPVMKVKVVHGPEPVPKELESKLPPKSEGSESSDDGSDFSWDEESVIDGHAWWEVGSQDEELEVSTMSPNLQSILGLAKPSDGAPGRTGVGEGGDENNDWRPPSFSGLDNSNPIRTLTPLVVGQNKGLQVEYKKKRQEGEGDGNPQEDGDEEWSEEEGWDYEDVPDDEYVLDWSTSISPNLAKAMGRRSSGAEKVEVLSAELSWKPPASSGLKNSMPIIDPSRLDSKEKRLG